MLVITEHSNIFSNQLIYIAMKPFLILITLTLSVMSEIVAQNPGEVIFSSSPIDPQNPTALKTDFNAGDPIYAVAYYPLSIQEIYNAQPGSKLEVEIFIYELKPPLYDYQQPYEEQLTFASMRVSGKLLKDKYLVIDLAPKPDNTNAYGTPEITYKEFGKKFDGPVNFAEALSKLSNGEHNLSILVSAYYNTHAKGSIKISGSDFGVYGKLSEELNQAAQNAGAKNEVFPQPQKKDAAIESRMIAAVKNSNDWKSGWLGGTELIKISIVDADWYVRRNEFSGAILHRYIRAAIAIKTKEGNCAYFQATFQEDYEGGKYQPLKYDGAGDRIPILCENLSK